MLAYMNAAGLRGDAAHGARLLLQPQPQKLWRKGEESGNVQELRRIYFDCDADTLLVKVHQIGGAACHEGYRSCFFRRIDPQTRAVEVEGERVFDPAESRATRSIAGSAHSADVRPCRSRLETRHPRRQPAGGHGPAVQAGRLQHHVLLALLLPARSTTTRSNAC